VSGSNSVLQPRHGFQHVLCSLLLQSVHHLLPSAVRRCCVLCCCGATHTHTHTHTHAYTQAAASWTTTACARCCCTAASCAGCSCRAQPSSCTARAPQQQPCGAAATTQHACSCLLSSQRQQGPPRQQALQQHAAAAATAAAAGGTSQPRPALARLQARLVLRLAQLEPRQVATCRWGRCPLLSCLQQQRQQQGTQAQRTPHSPTACRSCAWMSVSSCLRRSCGGSHSRRSTGPSTQHCCSLTCAQQRARSGCRR
jgi:hypothetical protein